MARPFPPLSHSYRCANHDFDVTQTRSTARVLEHIPPFESALRPVWRQDPVASTNFMKTISVAFYPFPFAQNFVVTALASIWKSEGFRVEFGSSYAQDADACLLHHNLTFNDTTNLPKPPASGNIINGQVHDISKRRISTLLLTKNADWPGMVIIKSNFNHFGAPERRLSQTGVLEKLRRLAARLSWRVARRLPANTYPILDGIADVPDWVWEDADLVVERFMPEMSDGLYSLRGWLFLGSKGYAYRLFATDPLVKTGSMVRYEYCDEVPGKLQEMRRKLGFDFGKFDYVMHGGEPILLDANKTPSFAGRGDTPRMKALASGIRDFL
ncbi:hypothetical protein H2509_04050 [Stappia sp. F7233]|uniref:ATP-grasp domain-containing protein n=1 Tax=Stappia albiluteola TaxID=2758565 RepID=A0A839ABA0_9HYPH|nr:hypothetical protein [Stappia albiluteola]MBA5776294.1 hypothetical protein [Stappia albiluteola]